MEFLHTKKNGKTSGSAFKISEMYCVDTDNWVLVSNTEAKMVTCQDAKIKSFNIKIILKRGENKLHVHKFIQENTNLKPQESK